LADGVVNAEPAVEIISILAGRNLSIVVQDRIGSSDIEV
jgi:hypothetical protein